MGFPARLFQLLAFRHDSPDIKSVPAITVEELHRRVSAGEPTFLLDVRTEQEYAAFHLAFTNALIAYDQLAVSLQSLPADKLTPIYTFCRSGRRSHYAAEYLRSIGFANSYNVTGGILAWIKAGFETVGS